MFWNGTSIHGIHTVPEQKHYKTHVHIDSCHLCRTRVQPPQVMHERANIY